MTSTRCAEATAFLASRLRPLLATMLATCGLIAAGTSPAIAAPANDAFINATTLPSATTASISASNVGATNETGEDSCCWEYDTIWYKWTAPKTGNYRLEICGSSFNTHLRVYTGTAVDALQEIADNNDDPGCGPDGSRSRLTFVAGAGQEYKFQIGSQIDDQQGSISGSLALVSPPNDFFADATTLDGTSAPISATNVDATNESGEDHCCWEFNTVWYKWTAPKTGNYRLEVCGSSFNTHLKVFTGTAVNALERIAENDDDPACGPDGSRSRLTFVAGAGQQYRIQIGSQIQNQTGTITGSLALVSPPNDFFADAQNLGAGSTAAISGKNIDASTEQGEPTCCFTSATVWYRWTAPAAGSYRVETCASDFKTYIKVLQGTAVTTLERIAENSGSAGCGPANDRAAVIFTAGANATYYIQIGSAADPRGNISGSISPAAPAADATPKLFPDVLPSTSKPPITGGGVRRVRGKYVLKVKGSFKLPPGYTVAQACNGTIILTVKKGRTLITARTTKLSSTCTYRKTIQISRRKLGRAKKLRLTVRFGGNRFLAATEKTYTVKVKR
jgi:hypothetical protein